MKRFALILLAVAVAVTLAAPATVDADHSGQARSEQNHRRRLRRVHAVDAVGDLRQTVAGSEADAVVVEGNSCSLDVVEAGRDQNGRSMRGLVSSLPAEKRHGAIEPGILTLF